MWSAAFRSGWSATSRTVRMSWITAVPGVPMTPDELHRMMIDLIRERDEIRHSIESWGEIDANAGAAAVSTEIRDRVERLRGMMRQASHLVDGIDEVAKLFPAGVSEHLDAH